ncbi:uncharacterized protein LOC125217883 isoform X2 [Salvia hispanica]|uniref:uncharacterized protein LOC125217883 isoform X2 n=1 Tax=Salvia hispanica TaxID=49212 RepID=UPI002009D28B|nr:uncharacterized protein LOC125217883 isoform X2 [Salvia hispanica]
MEAEASSVSSAEAVMLGALAPGVNMAFFMLGVCLAAMLGLAFSSRDSSLIFHVAFLVLIAATLFVLLSGFLAETGLVSVEHQMQEIGLGNKDAGKSKSN